jgi:hypothetical protein
LPLFTSKTIFRRPIPARLSETILIPGDFYNERAASPVSLAEVERTFPYLHKGHITIPENLAPALRRPDIQAHQGLRLVRRVAGMFLYAAIKNCCRLIHPVKSCVDMIVNVILRMALDPL